MYHCYTMYRKARQQTNPLARAIRSIRVNLRESQTEFGARFNVCYITVLRWETARTIPSPGLLALLISMATTVEQEEILFAALKASGFPVDQLPSLGIRIPRPSSFPGSVTAPSTASIAPASGEGNVRF